MGFRYLRDPLFLVSVVLYVVNRFVFKPLWPDGFFHDHLNDVLCIPFWVPVMVWIERHLSLRTHDGPPEVAEVVVPLLLWSWLFEIVLPRTEWFGPYCVADHLDVLSYAAGALAAMTFWHVRYKTGRSTLDR